jgi:hypothetical protein
VCLRRIHPGVARVTPRSDRGAAGRMSPIGFAGRRGEPLPAVALGTPQATIIPL